MSAGTGRCPHSPPNGRAVRASHKPSFYNVAFRVDETDEYVIFNTFGRALVVVDEHVARSLEPAKRNGSSAIAGDVTEDELDKLVQSGIVVSQFLDERAGFRYAMNRQKYRSTLVPLFISFSSRCNFACPYCYESERAMLSEKADLSHESWRGFFRFLKSHLEAESANQVIAAFYGGEPLMNYEVVLQAAGDLHALAVNGFKVGTSLITNGSLLTKERIGELAPFLNSVQITLDGPPDVHNQTRPYADGAESYDDVLRAICMCMEVAGLETIVRVNVTSHTADRVQTLLRNLCGVLPLHLGLTVSLAPVHGSQREMHCGAGRQLDLPLLRRVAALSLEAAKLGYGLGQSFIPGPCMVSFANSMTVDEALNVYRCPGRIYECPDARIAADGSLEVLRNEWYTYVDFEPACALSCKYGPICYGGCRWKAGSETETACPKAWLEEGMRDLVLAYVHAQHGEHLAV